MTNYKMKKIFLFSTFILFMWNVNAQIFTENDIKKGYISCLDNKIYYEEVGKGEALILAHAGYLDCSMWDDQFLYFANKGFKVIRFDSYAHGKTIDGKNTPFLHELIKALVDELSLGQVNLIGTSMGGVTLIEFALNHPEDINKMILVSTGINGYNWATDKLFIPNLRKQLEYITNQDTLNAAEIFLRSWFDGPYRQPTELPTEKRTKSKKVILDRFKNHGLRKNALSSHPKAIERYEKIKTNTLILVGDQDMPSIKDISSFLDEGMENSKKIEIKGVGHMMNIENPVEFNKLVLEFLK